MFLIGLLNLRHVLPARQNMIRVGTTASEQRTKRPPDLGQAVARDDNQGDAPSRVMQKLGAK